MNIIPIIKISDKIIGVSEALNLKFNELTVNTESWTLPYSNDNLDFDGTVKGALNTLIEHSAAQNVNLLSITTAPGGSFSAGSKYYNSSSKKIVTAVSDNTWTGAEETDPKFGVIYLFQGTPYTWDGNSLEETDTDLFQLKSNIVHDYMESSKSTYPSSYALYKGINSVKPMRITNSGGSLPPVTEYQLGDTFLNTTDKKLYTAKADSYEWNTNVTAININEINFETGIVTNLYTGSPNSHTLLRIFSNQGLWVGNKNYQLKFKITSFPTNNYIFALFSIGGNNGSDGTSYRSFGINTDRKLLYVESNSSYGSTTIIKEVVILDTQLQANKDYILKINKLSSTVEFILLENTIEIDSNSIEVTDISQQSYPHGKIYMGVGYFSNGYGGYRSLYTYASIYLLESSGDFLKASGILVWNNGEDLIDLSQYADITNGIMYFYCDNILFSNAPTFARLIGQPEDNINLAAALNAKQDVSNLSQDYNETSTTKYPSSKALSDGLNASFPIIVTDSGSSLPSASGYNEGDTFLNSTTKKIYQIETTITGYQLNTNVQNSATIDLLTGIVNGFVAASGSNKKSIINMDTNFIWKDDVLLEIHFKLNNYDDYMVLLNLHTGGYNNKEVILYLKDRKLYCSYMYGNPGPINTYTFFTLADYQLSTDTEYFIKINKNGTNITTSIFTQGYDINKEYEETIANIEDWYIDGVNSSRIEYGAYSNGPLESMYSPKGFGGDIYLADSVGDFLIPISSTSWDNGIDLLNKTKYVDKTNGILYLYVDNQLFYTDKIPSQSGNAGKFLSTDGSNLTWSNLELSTIDKITKIILGGSNSVNLEEDLSDSVILGVYLNGLHQLDDEDYTITTESGESTITLTATLSEDSKITVVYATNLRLSNLSYNDLSNKPQINGVTLTGNVDLNSLGVQSANLLFTNKSASNWVADNTYPDYGYKCEIACEGVTENSFAQVVFAQAEADSGNYATVCLTTAGKVTIYSKVDDSITIPNIVVMGA